MKRAIGRAILVAILAVPIAAVGIRVSKLNHELSYKKWRTLKTETLPAAQRMQLEAVLQKSFEIRDAWKVRRAANQILFKEPKNSKALYHRAWAEFELGLPEEGASFLDAAKKISDENPVFLGTTG